MRHSTIGYMSHTLYIRATICNYDIETNQKVVVSLARSTLTLVPNPKVREKNCKFWSEIETKNVDWENETKMREIYYYWKSSCLCPRWDFSTKGLLQEILTTKKCLQFSLNFCVVEIPYVALWSPLHYLILLLCDRQKLWCISYLQGLVVFCEPK